MLLSHEVGSLKMSLPFSSSFMKTRKMILGLFLKLNSGKILIFYIYLYKCSCVYNIHIMLMCLPLANNNSCQQQQC